MNHDPVDQTFVTLSLGALGPPPFSPFFYFFLFETLSCGNAFGLDFWLRYNMTELSTFFPFFLLLLQLGWLGAGQGVLDGVDGFILLS